MSYYVGFIIMALKYSLKSSMIIPPMTISPSVFFFVLSALAIFSLLCLHRKFEIILPVEEGCGFFFYDCNEFIYYLWESGYFHKY